MQNDNWKHSSLVNMLSWNYKDKSSDILGKDVDIDVIHAFKTFLDEFERSKANELKLTDEERKRLKLIANKILSLWQDKCNSRGTLKRCSSDYYDESSNQSFNENLGSTNSENKMSISNILNMDIRDENN